MSSTAETATGIRPFHVDIPDEALEDLRRRIAATNWPEKETVADQSQGVPLAMIQKLARYWGTGYDWRRCEARLSALPQFMTEIDGLDIHFIHVRSKHEDALPLIVNHGWPGIDGITIWKASAALAPWAVGSVSGPMIFSCSMTEPGQPWLTTSGKASSCFERTWMKWMFSPSISVMKCGRAFSVASHFRQS